MSGLVASRLYSLLPPRMPLEAKYKLTEVLWRHVGPSSKKTLRVGSDASIDAIVEIASKHIDEVVTEYKIPDKLERRFEWLSSGDVEVKQRLLIHLRMMEKALPIRLTHTPTRASVGRHGRDGHPRARRSGFSPVAP